MPEESYLQARKVEVSTWRGLIELLASLGIISVTADQTTALVFGFIAVSSFLKMVLPDQWRRKLTIGD
jgi:hypothetical protein